MEDNRRKHPRVPVQSHCWCESDHITLYAKLVNVSEGGAFIRTYAPLRAGSTATIRFQVDGREIIAQAVVVWVREEPPEGASPGMALQFVGIDDASVKGIRELVVHGEGTTGRMGNS